MQNSAVLYKVTVPDQELISREDGKKLRESISKELDSLPNGGSIMLDFSSIRLITITATNQVVFLWKSVISGEFGEKFVVLYGLPEVVKDSFRNALSGAHTVMVMYNCSVLELIGYTEAVNIEDWNYVNSGSGISSSDMMRDFPDLSINSCNNRLKNLYNKRLIARVKKKSQWVYSAVPHK